MASETIDPGRRVPPPDAPRHAPPSSLEITAGTAGEPSPPGAVTTSDDELSLLLSPSVVKPDPMLGTISSDKGRRVRAADALSQRAGRGTGARGAFAGIVRRGRGAEYVHGGGAHRTRDRAASTSAIGRLGLVQSVPRPQPGAPFLSAAKSAAPKKKEEEEVGEDEDDMPPRGASWPFMLLLSYASAVTIGLIWVLWDGRKSHESDDDLFPPANTASTPDPGRRADLSRKVVTPPPITADHLTTLGKTLRMGSLEATPLGVSSGLVKLQRTFDSVQDREGGGNALRLELRLKNISTDAIFTPLDEAFLRERDRGILDSLIVTSDGRQIEMFPLAVASEWSILGQEFRELRPGESYVTEIVSAPDIQDRKPLEMTWRVRLRTGINKTEMMGVRFREDEIK